jgi:mRNA interferase HigB
VNFISKRGLMERAKKHPASVGELTVWYGIARRAEWSRLEDVRSDFPSADRIGRVLVFNVGWNACRLIVTVDYSTKRLFVKALLTHREYDRKEWMKWTKL